MFNSDDKIEIELQQELENPHFENYTEAIVDKLINEIKFNNLNFKTIIRNFSKNISDLRDIFLKKYKIDINQFIEDNFDENILSKIEKDIFNYL